MDSGKKRKRLAIIGIIIAVAAGALYMNKDALFKKDEAKTTTTETTASRGDLMIGFEADGTANVSYTNLDFEITGKLSSVNVSEGDIVKKGQVLARLDDSDMKKDYQNAKINYEKALYSYTSKVESRNLTLLSEKQKVTDNLSAMNKAKRDYDNMKGVADAYATVDVQNAKIAYDSARVAYESQKSRYAQLSSSTTDLSIEKANIESARVALSTASSNLEKAVLVSPKAGKVLKVTKKAGENVASSSTQTSTLTDDTTHLIIIGDTDHVDIVAPVSESDLATVKDKMNSEVSFEAIEGKVFKGTVSHIATLPKIDSSGIVTYDVTVRLASGIDKIKQGMTCAVSFILKKAEDKVIIENKAVTLNKGVQSVLVKKDDGTTEKRTITTGLTDGKKAVVESGLDGSETLLIETVVTSSSKSTNGNTTNGSTTTTNRNSTTTSMPDGPPPGGF